MSLHLCGFAISVTIRMEHVKSENQGKKLSYKDTQSKKKKPRSDHRCLDSWPRTLIVLKAGLMSNNLHYCIPMLPQKQNPLPAKANVLYFPVTRSFAISLSGIALSRQHSNMFVFNCGLLTWWNAISHENLNMRTMSICGYVSMDKPLMEKMWLHGDEHALIT